MNICEHIDATARIFPHKPAIIFEGNRFSYAQIQQLSVGASRALEAVGVAPGDRVAIQLGNVPAFAVWYYAILRVGGIAVSLSTRLATDEIDFMMTDCGATVLIAPDSQPISSQDLPQIVKKTFFVSDDASTSNGNPLDSTGAAPPIPDRTADRFHDASPDDAALILYTSGTTGFAKGATLSHQNVRSNVCAFNHLCGQTLESVVLLTVPLFHCFGQNALLNSCFHAGSTIVLQRKFDPAQSRRLIIEHQVNQLYGVPAMFQMLTECCTPTDLTRVNYCFSAATTLPIQVADAWRKKYSMPIYEGYGLTETSPFASYNHRLKFVPGSIGAPIDGCEMKIVDTETGVDCPNGTLGQIAIRGPNVMLGYWNQPEETSTAIRDGWFYSGDIGRRDNQGYFYIVDRVKDMISVGGLKVFPAEVERVLLDLEIVSEAAVVGIAGGVLGEQVVAWIVIDQDAAAGKSESDILANVKEHAREHLANYKTPKHVWSIAALPRNPAGKVLKKVLREQSPSVAMESIESDPENPAGVSMEVIQALRTTVAPQLREKLSSAYASEAQRATQTYLQNVIQNITGDTAPPALEDKLLDAGLDSLMLVELSHQLQAEVGSEVSISATLVFDYPRVVDLAAFLVSAIQESNSSSEANSVDALARVRANQFDAAQAEIDHGLRAVNRSATEIAAMSEEEVLEELIRELEE